MYTHTGHIHESVYFIKYIKWNDPNMLILIVKLKRNISPVRFFFNYPKMWCLVMFTVGYIVVVVVMHACISEQHVFNNQRSKHWYSHMITHCTYEFLYMWKHSTFNNRSKIIKIWQRFTTIFGASQLRSMSAWLDPLFNHAFRYSDGLHYALLFSSDISFTHIYN